MQSSAIGYVETAARRRAALYRDRAAELRRIAAAEPIGSLRIRLQEIARKYEELAASLGTVTRRSSPTRLSATHRNAVKKSRTDGQTF